MRLKNGKLFRKLNIWKSIKTRALNWRKPSVSKLTIEMELRCLYKRNYSYMFPDQMISCNCFSASVSSFPPWWSTFRIMTMVLFPPNVVNSNDFSSFSKPELEEILEDISWSTPIWFGLWCQWHENRNFGKRWQWNFFLHSCFEWIEFADSDHWCQNAEFHFSNLQKHPQATQVILSQK